MRVQTTATFKYRPADVSHSVGTWFASTWYKDDFSDWSVIAREMLATTNM
jgi:hypothetical protein